MTARLEPTPTPAQTPALFALLARSAPTKTAQESQAVFQERTHWQDQQFAQTVLQAMLARLPTVTQRSHAVLGLTPLVSRIVAPLVQQEGQCITIIQLADFENSLQAGF